MLRPDPSIIDNVFHKNDIDQLKANVLDYKNFPYDPGFGRYTIDQKSLPLLETMSNKLIIMSRYIFQSEHIKPTYALFSHYEGNQASLYKHKDDNACTYTIDYCVYQNTPWDLWVNNEPYTLQENQALAYYGNDQEHWRKEFPEKTTNKVGMVFFHFADPDHWWFTKGPSYIRVIRKEISEAEWTSSIN